MAARPQPPNAQDEEKKRARDRDEILATLNGSDVARTLFLGAAMSKISKDVTKFATGFTAIANLEISFATRAEMLQSFAAEHDALLDIVDLFRKEGEERDKREHEFKEKRRAEEEKATSEANGGEEKKEEKKE
jgi:hypothetical protein